MSRPHKFLTLCILTLSLQSTSFCPTPRRPQDRPAGQSRRAFNKAACAEREAKRTTERTRQNRIAMGHNLLTTFDGTNFYMDVYKESARGMLISKLISKLFLSMDPFAEQTTHQKHTLVVHALILAQSARAKTLDVPFFSWLPQEHLTLEITKLEQLSTDLEAQLRRDAELWGREFRAQIIGFDDVALAVARVPRPLHRAFKATQEHCAKVFKATT